MSKESTMETTKPEFGPSGLAKVVAEINQSFPEELERDWRAFVQHEFNLTSDQEESLARVPPNLVKEFQEYFRQASRHIKKGGNVHAQIIHLPPERTTPQAFHELHVSVESSGITPQLSIVIAHCDANCQNWGWGPG